MINWLSKPMLIRQRYQVIMDQPLKHSVIQNIEDVEEKIPNTSGLVKKTVYNSKITKIENKIPIVTGLVTTATFNTKAT